MKDDDDFLMEETSINDAYREGIISLQERDNQLRALHDEYLYLQESNDV